MGRPGWTAALGEGLAAALPREPLTHRERALLRTGAASVNDALKRLKAPPRWADLNATSQTGFTRCGKYANDTDLFVDDSGGGAGTTYGYSREDVEALV